MERPRRIMTSIMSIEDKNYVHHLELYCNYLEGRIERLLQRNENQAITIDCLRNSLELSSPFEGDK